MSGTHDDDAVEALWRTVLTGQHSGRFSSLPSTSRCSACRTPFSGIAGGLARLTGLRPARINPHLCNYCDDKLPPGGAEVNIAVLFADVRGSTGIAEGMSTRDYTGLINRFYNSASTALIGQRAIIDKLIGDEIMAFFIPADDFDPEGIGYRVRAVAAAVEILESVGYGTDEEPWLPLAIGVHAGEAFVGKVGSEGVYSFTAIGDTVNTAARLRSDAQAGEILLGDSIYQSVSAQYPDLTGRDMTVRGRSEPVRVFSLRPTGALR